MSLPGHNDLWLYAYKRLDMLSNTTLHIIWFLTLGTFTLHDIGISNEASHSIDLSHWPTCYCRWNMFMFLHLLNNSWGFVYSDEIPYFFMCVFHHSAKCRQWVNIISADYLWTVVRLQNLPWSKTGLVSRQVLHPLSKLQNWIRSKTGRYKTGLVSNTKIEASLRATKHKPWQSNLTSDTVEIFIQNEKAGLVPMQSRFRSRHKAGFGAAGLGTAQSWFWNRHKASFGAVSRPV